MRFVVLLLLTVATASAQSVETAFTLPDRAFAAEGLALLPDSSWAISSVHLGTVVRVSRDGTVVPFVRAPGAWSVLGMEADATDLWATTVAWPQARDADSVDHGRTALVAFDLNTGEIARRIEAQGALGDLALGTDGTVYTTDGLEGTVYALRGDSLHVLVPRGVLHSPQGLAFGADPSRLFLVDYRYGLVSVDTEAGAVTIVPHVPGAEDRGVDGLAYAEGALYAVQNGIAPHRVWRWRLSPDESRVVAVDELASAEGDDRFSEPTLAAVAGGWVYVVSASGWAQYAEDGTLDVESAPLPTVVRMRR